MNRIFHLFLKNGRQYQRRIPFSCRKHSKNEFKLFTANEPKSYNNILDDNLNIKLNNDYFVFPYIWLRDNCQCPNCFHSNSKSRIIYWKTFNIQVKPESIVTNDNNVTIKWNDNHLSTYTYDWLYERNFSLKNRENFLINQYRPKRHPWGKDDFNLIVKRFDFQSILNENAHLKRWLNALSTFGIAIIECASSEKDSCRKLANRVEFIKRTHYGEEFTVREKPGATNVAYLSSNLQMHTDLPYYEYKPGVNLLHCVTQSQSKGGENLLSDGLFTALQMKTNNKDHYDILSQTLVDWEDFGKEGNNEFHSIYRSPVICEDLDGEIVRVNHSVPQRSSHFNIPVDRIKSWYEAMEMFVKLIHENSANYKVAQGEILCFDNKRLLHGRLEYQDTPSNTRHIIGAYLDWDFIFSRLRVLSNK